ncbi:MAG: hypothetical protein APR56_00750 [Methanosaeta sp. SDB]|nr:MAG: hypothetical protein APR56_00750 [Methanosaeta sp. SDB]
MCDKSIIQMFLILSILAVSLSPSSSQSEMAEDDLEIAEPSWFMVTRISPSYSKDIVADFEALTDSQELPDHLAGEDAEKVEGDFDVGLYFTILDQLSMKGGRVLDYVYHYAGIGGAPVLYARKAVVPPYRNYSEYLAAEATAEPEEREDYYLRFVDTGGTPEGFFQLTLLMIQGEQFYQFWHAAYNDDRIVSDLEDARASLGGGWVGVDESTVEGLLADLGKFDLAPVVSMGRDLVKVEVVAFTKWGGFVKRSIVMEREFPHLILEEKSEVLVPYECGILF